MKNSKTVAYHCSRCGGIITPSDPCCPYCGQPNDIYWESKNQKVRVLVNGIYLNAVTSIGEMVHDPCIDTVSLTDGWSTYVCGVRQKSSGSLKMETAVTKHFLEQADFFNCKQGSIVNVELPGVGMFEFMGKPSVGLMKMEIGQIGTCEIDFYAEQIKGWNQDIWIPDIICPNCGGLITEAYGCCPWCGGWVEWLRV